MNAALERARRPLTASVIGAAVLYLGAVALSDGSAVMDRIGRLPAWGIGAALALPTLGYAVRFLRWDRYLVRLGHRLPPGRHARIYLAGFALTTTPGKVGENLRAMYLLPFGVPVSASLGAFVAERLTDLLAMVLLSGLAFRLVGSHAWALGASVAVTLLGLAVLRDPRLPGLLDRRAAGGGRGARALAGAARALDAARSLLRPGPLLMGLLAGLVAWGAEAWTFALLVGFVGIDLPAGAAMGVFAVGTLVGAASFLPGGVGPTEVVMAGLLVVGGAEVPEATAATLLIRAFTLWWAVALGAGALLGLSAPGTPGEAERA